MNPQIAVIDYGAGNLRSIRRALEAAGADVTVTTDPRVIAGADAIVLPGVGAAGAAMRRLRELSLPPIIAQAVDASKPFLGVCLGMQLLFQHQAEGDTEGLGLLAGSVRPLTGPVKLPQIGWNRVRFVRPNPFTHEGDEGDYYFVHSYIVQPEDPSAVVAVAHYGEVFPAIVAHDNVMGTQFHPEKSRTAGLAMIRAFVRQVEASMRRPSEAIPA